MKFQQTCDCRSPFSQRTLRCVGCGAPVIEKPPLPQWATNFICGVVAVLLFTLTYIVLAAITE